MKNRLLTAFLVSILTLNAAQAQSLNLPFKTLSEGEVAQLAQSARAQLKSLEKVAAPAAQSPCYVAISFSMPKSSLMRVAADAARAGIPLVLRGVGEKPILQKTQNAQALTQEKLYGKGWLSRHIGSIKPLSDLGASVLIDPKRFTEEAISAVPTLICEDAQGKTYRAVGDVTLGYALSSLIRENALEAAFAEEIRKLAASLGDAP